MDYQAGDVVQVKMLHDGGSIMKAVVASIGNEYGRVMLALEREYQHGDLHSWAAPLIGQISPLAIQACQRLGIDINQPVFWNINIGQSEIIGLVKEADISSGAKCSKCREFNEFVPASDTFICWGCRH